MTEVMEFKGYEYFCRLYFILKLHKSVVPSRSFSPPLFFCELIVSPPGFYFDVGTDGVVDCQCSHHKKGRF